MSPGELPLPEGRGFWLRWRLPCARISPRAWSSIASTSSSGHSTRQHPQPFVADVDSRVDVPVVVSAAMGTRPRPHIERHLVADRTTGITCLGTRIPTVASQECLSGACSLVFEEAREHAPSRVSRSFRKAVVRHDPFHMQVFDGDDLVFVNDAPTEFVKVVPSGARHTFMRAGHQSPGLVPAVRSFLLARQLALFPFQVFFRLLQVAGIVELRAVAGDNQMRQTDIEADRLAFGRYSRQGLAGISEDRGMVLTAGVPAHRDGLYLANDVSVDDAFHPADFWQVDARAVDLHALRILDRLAPVLGLEPGILAALGEEVLVCSRKVLKRLLQDLGISITKPLELLLQFWQANTHRLIVQPFAGRAIQIARSSKSVVPDPTRAPELNSQGLSLLVSRIETNPGGVEHVLDIARSRLTPQESVASRRHALYPRPEGRGFTAKESNWQASIVEGINFVLL